MLLVPLLVGQYGMATADAHAGLPLNIFDPEANKLTNITDFFFNKTNITLRTYHYIILKKNNKKTKQKL